jgi:hypothetical protein
MWVICACTSVITCAYTCILHPSNCTYDIDCGSSPLRLDNHTRSELLMLAILSLSRIHVRVVNRQPSQKLGANGRDDGPLVSILCLEDCYFLAKLFFISFFTWEGDLDPYSLFISYIPFFTVCPLLTQSCLCNPVNRFPVGGA